MKFDSINEKSKVYPGEYLLHEPTMQIVVCGAFNWDENFVRCLASGRMLEDSVDKFKKIRLSAEEHRERQHSRCKGCSGPK